MLKKGEYYLGQYAASKLVAQSNYIKNNRKTLAYRIRGLFRHFRTFGGLSAKTCKGKRKGSLYLDNENIF